MKMDFFETLDPTGWHTGQKIDFHLWPCSEYLIDFFPYVFTIERYCNLVIFNKIACKPVILCIFSLNWLLGWKVNIKLHHLCLGLRNIYYQNFIVHPLKCRHSRTFQYSDFDFSEEKCDIMMFFPQLETWIEKKTHKILAFPARFAKKLSSQSLGTPS